MALILNAAGLATRITRRPAASIVWAKLFVNVGINALTALLRCPNGALAGFPGDQGKNDNGRAGGRGGGPGRRHPHRRRSAAATFRVCAATRTNISSMHQDIRNRRRTEIDAINGAVVAAGSKLGVPTPVNAELVRQVKELESAFADAGEGQS